MPYCILCFLRKKLKALEYTQNCSDHFLSYRYLHSIMMVKSAQTGEGGGCTPSPFHSISHHHERSCGVHSIAETRADTLPIFLLCPYKYSVKSTFPPPASLSNRWPGGGGGNVQYSTRSKAQSGTANRLSCALALDLVGCVIMNSRH